MRQRGRGSVDGVKIFRTVRRRDYADHAGRDDTDGAKTHSPVT
jgi:hypothetical protein